MKRGRIQFGFGKAGAAPDAEITSSRIINDDAWRCTFVEAEGEDRDQLFERMIAMWKSFEMYAENAGRYIPVFRIVLGDRPLPLHEEHRLKEVRAGRLREGVLRNLAGTESYRIETFAPGAVVFRQGDPADRLYLVLEGRARLVVFREARNIPL